MEEMREAAVAYYNNASEELRQRAWEFFQSMDMDGNGRVSFHEFVEFVRQGEYPWVHTNIFSELGRHNNGFLDFWDVLTLYYTVKTRHVPCKGCHRLCLEGLYFTCVQCFDCPGDTYDLCVPCHRERRFYHHHTIFLDSYVLLRSKRGAGAANINPPNGPQPVNIIIQNDPPGTRWTAALQALELGANVAIGSLTAAGVCSIL